MKNFLIILLTLSTLGNISSASIRTARASSDLSSFKPRQTPYIKQNRFVIPLNHPYPYSISYVEHSLPISRTVNVVETPAEQYPNAQALLMPDSQPQYLSIPIPLGAKSSVMYWPQQPAVRTFETRNEQVPQYPATHEKSNQMFAKDQYEAVPYKQEVQAPEQQQNPSASQEQQHYWSAQYVQQPYEQQKYTAPQITHQFYQKPEVVTPIPLEQSKPTETLFTPPNTYQFDQNQPHPYYISIPEPLAYRNYY